MADEVTTTVISHRINHLLYSSVWYGWYFPRRLYFYSLMAHESRVACLWNISLHPLWL